MNYQAKPHRINAFHFKTTSLKPPKWFRIAHEEGRVSVTITEKEQYITIYASDSESLRGYMGCWVCQNETGTIFTLGHDEFQEQFEPAHV